MGEKAKRKKAEKALKKARKAEAKAAPDAGATIPEEIAGIPLPKEVRDAGSKLIAFASSPIGREMIGIGVTIAAAAAQAALAGKGKAPGATGAAEKKRGTGEEIVSAAVDGIVKSVVGAVKRG